MIINLDENKDVLKCLYCVPFFDTEFFKHWHLENFSHIFHLIYLNFKDLITYVI